MNPRLSTSKLRPFLISLQNSQTKIDRRRSTTSNINSSFQNTHRHLQGIRTMKTTREISENQKFHKAPPRRMSNCNFFSLPPLSKFYAEAAVSLRLQGTVFVDRSRCTKYIAQGNSAHSPSSMYGFRKAIEKFIKKRSLFCEREREIFGNLKTLRSF